MGRKKKEEDTNRDELTGRVNNVFHVIKENGFTNYSTDLEIS